MSAAGRIPWGEPVAIDPKAQDAWRRLLVARPIRGPSSLSMGAKVTGVHVSGRIHRGEGRDGQAERRGFAWEASQNIGVAIGMVSARQVDRYFDELEGAGFIRLTPNFVGRASGIELMWPALGNRADTSNSGFAIGALTKDPLTGQFRRRQSDISVRGDRSDPSRDLLDLDLSEGPSGARGRP